MKRPLVTAALAFCAALAHLPASANAEQSLAERIKTRAADIQRHLDLLKSRDQATRLAALTEMGAARDPAIVDLAVETALSSKDPAMRAIGLRAAFRQLRSLVATLQPDNTEAARKVIEACGSATQYRIEDYAYEAGTFKVHGQDNVGVGQVSGSTVSITIDYGCSLSGRLRDDGTLEGLVSAPYKKGALPMHTNVR